MADLLAKLEKLSKKCRKFADTDYTKGQKVGDARKQGQYELMMAGQSLAYAMVAEELSAIIAHSRTRAAQPKSADRETVCVPHKRNLCPECFPEPQPSGESQPPALEVVQQAMERMRIASDRDHTDIYFGTAEPIKSVDVRNLLSFVREGQLRADELIEKCAEVGEKHYGAGVLGPHMMGVEIRNLKGTALLAAPAPTKENKNA